VILYLESLVTENGAAWASPECYSYRLFLYCESLAETGAEAAVLAEMYEAAANAVDDPDLPF
jgi:hypothetical protein